MSCLFGGNSCTWVLILVIIFLLSQNNCFCDNDSCDSRSGGCGNFNNSCGCGC